VAEESSMSRISGFIVLVDHTADHGRINVMH
jgi:hypothetical protein